MHKHLHRLDKILVSDPIFYITTCTLDRKPILANAPIHDICCEVWRNAEQHYGWMVGRYVVMPDHVHFFCAPRTDQCSLQFFVGKWKEWTAKYAKRRHNLAVPFWQPDFFDHVLRSSEHYEEKWGYVRDNPLRAGLVTSVEDWPYQGQMNELRWQAIRAGLAEASYSYITAK